MMTNAIVLGAIILAVLYSLVWIMRRDFRLQIERPKYRFQDQIEAYDKRISEQQKTENEK
jgi:hypothetical protein